MGWEQNTGPALNHSDYYHFWVVHTLPTEGSKTVGHYAVNKHTADVWIEVPEPEMVTSPLLEGIQRILRKAHHIETPTILKYRNRHVWAPTR